MSTASNPYRGFHFPAEIINQAVWLYHRCSLSLRDVELDMQPGTPDKPASVRFALLRYVRGEDGRLYMMPEGSSFEAVEEQIESLQDGMGSAREPARRSKPPQIGI